METGINTQQCTYLGSIGQRRHKRVTSQVMHCKFTLVSMTNLEFWR